MYSFVLRDPHRAYLGSELHLPKEHINTAYVKSQLEFIVTIDGEQEFLHLWEETDNHIVVPRCFFSEQHLVEAPFEITSLLPTDFPAMRIESNIILDRDWLDTDDVQRRAFATWLRTPGGIFNIACGRGKTVIALHCVAHTKHPALIIVEKGDLLRQWSTQAKALLTFDGPVGMIQGDPSTWDWQRPITIAMMQTLALYPDAVTPEMRRWFYTIWWDEVHHLSAPTFCPTASMFPGVRHGLSATIEREDGLDPIFLYHVGRPIFTDLYQAITPDIYFRQTPFTVDMHDPEVFAAVTDRNGELHISRLRSYMGTRPDRIAYQCHDLRRAVEAGRKILALSHCREQLYTMQRIFGDEVAGVITGREAKAKRGTVLREKQLVFGTHQLVLEGLDEPSLDFIVWLTPFGSQHPQGGVNALQQGIGRGQRYMEGKPTPKILIYDDIHVALFHRMCIKLRRQLRRWPEEKGGPYEYTELNLLEVPDVS